MQPLTGMTQQHSGATVQTAEPAALGLPLLSGSAGASFSGQPALRTTSAGAMSISQTSADSQQLPRQDQAVQAAPAAVSQMSSTVTAGNSRTAAPSGSVGGLPLAFLRSFYAQMSPEQQALFWRDLRQMRGGSAEEQAVYRELAESSGGLARIESAITMLVAFEDPALADRLLSRAAESEDPTIQQAARTALAMLPARTRP